MTVNKKRKRTTKMEMKIRKPRGKPLPGQESPAKAGLSIKLFIENVLLDIFEIVL